MVNSPTTKKSPCNKKMSEKVKLCKKNFLEKSCFVITKRLSCQRKESLDAWESGPLQSSGRYETIRSAMSK
jgi:hypothetical protein